MELVDQVKQALAALYLYRLLLLLLLLLLLILLYCKPHVTHGLVMSDTIGV